MFSFQETEPVATEGVTATVVKNHDRIENWTDRDTSA